MWRKVGILRKTVSVIDLHTAILCLVDIIRKFSSVVRKNTPAAEQTTDVMLLPVAGNQGVIETISVIALLEHNLSGIDVPVIIVIV